MGKVFEIQEDEKFVNLLMVVLNKNNPTITKEDVERTVRECVDLVISSIPNVIDSSLYKYSTGQRAKANRGYYEMVGFHMLGVEYHGTHIWNPITVKRDLMDVASALSIIIEYLYSVDNCLFDYFNSGDAVVQSFVACIKQHVRTFEELHEAWKLSSDGTKFNGIMNYITDKRRLPRESLQRIFLSADKPKFIGGSNLNTCKYVEIYVTAKSNPTLEEMKGDKDTLVGLIKRRLKSISSIKRNPDLLKYLRISKIDYIPTGARCVVEWKPGFVYEYME